MIDVLHRLQRIRVAVQQTAGIAADARCTDVASLLSSIDDSLDELEVDVRHALMVASQ